MRKSSQSSIDEAYRLMKKLGFVPSQAGVPMDPAMAGGAPMPMDPAMAGAPPGAMPPEMGGAPPMPAMPLPPELTAGPPMPPPGIEMAPMAPEPAMPMIPPGMALVPISALQDMMGQAQEKADEGKGKDEGSELKNLRERLEALEGQLQELLQLFMGGAPAEGEALGSPLPLPAEAMSEPAAEEEAAEEPGVPAPQLSSVGLPPEIRATMGKIHKLHGG